MRFISILYVIGGSLVIYGTIVLYVLQFQLFSSLIDRKVMYIQSLVVTVLLIVFLVYFLYWKQYGLKALDKAKVLVSGIVVFIILSPLLVVLINKISIKCESEVGIVFSARKAMSQRFGILEGEQTKPDFIDVYFLTDDHETLKVRKYAPIHLISEGSQVEYEKCTGLLKLQWLRLPENQNWE